jgi:hypothetical protein
MRYKIILIITTIPPPLLKQTTLNFLTVRAKAKSSLEETREAEQRPDQPANGERRFSPELREANTVRKPLTCLPYFH